MILHSRETLHKTYSDIEQYTQTSKLYYGSKFGQTELSQHLKPYLIGSTVFFELTSENTVEFENDDESDGFVVQQRKSRKRKCPPGANIVEFHRSLKKLSVQDIHDFILNLYDVYERQDSGWYTLPKTKTARRLVCLIVPYLDSDALGELKRAEYPILCRLRKFLFQGYPIHWSASEPSPDASLQSLMTVSVTRRHGDGVSRWVKALEKGDDDPRPACLVPYPIAAYLLPLHRQRYLRFPDVKDGVVPAGYVMLNSEGPGVVDTAGKTTLVGDRDFARMVALDCEMVQTVQDLELGRLSVVSSREEVLLDCYVSPSGFVTDYLTKYSGLRRECFQVDEHGMSRFDGKPVLSFEDARQALLKLLTADSVLCGHSLENDLRALKLIHKKVIDTSEVFARSGLGYTVYDIIEYNTKPFSEESSQSSSQDQRSSKCSLAYLAKRILNIEMDRQKGHDSVDDARICMQLILRIAERGPDGYSSHIHGSDGRNIPLWQILSDIQFSMHSKAQEDLSLVSQENFSVVQSIREAFDSSSEGGVVLIKLPQYKLACDAVVSLVSGTPDPRPDALEDIERLLADEIMPLIREQDVVLLHSLIGDAAKVAKLQSMLENIDGQEKPASKALATKALLIAKHGLNAPFVVLCNGSDLVSVDY